MPLRPEALKWAQENPNEPEAAQIMKMSQAEQQAQQKAAPNNFDVSGTQDKQSLQQTGSTPLQKTEWQQKMDKLNNFLTGAAHGVTYGALDSKEGAENYNQAMKEDPGTTTSGNVIGGGATTAALSSVLPVGAVANAAKAGVGAAGLHGLLKLLGK